MDMYPYNCPEFKRAKYSSCVKYFENKVRVIFFRMRDYLLFICVKRILPVEKKVGIHKPLPISHRR